VTNVRQIGLELLQVLANLRLRQHHDPRRVRRQRFGHSGRFRGQIKYVLILLRNVLALPGREEHGPRPDRPAPQRERLRQYPDEIPDLLHHHRPFAHQVLHGYGHMLQRDAGARRPDLARQRPGPGKSRQHKALGAGW
jgi:hypothetical protein